MSDRTWRLRIDWAIQGFSEPCVDDYTITRLGRETKEELEKIAQEIREKMCTDSLYVLTFEGGTCTYRSNTILRVIVYNKASEKVEK